MCKCTWKISAKKTKVVKEGSTPEKQNHAQLLTLSGSGDAGDDTFASDLYAFGPELKEKFRCLGSERTKIRFTTHISTYKHVFGGGIVGFADMPFRKATADFIALSTSMMLCKFRIGMEAHRLRTYRSTTDFASTLKYRIHSLNNTVPTTRLM